MIPALFFFLKYAFKTLVAGKTKAQKLQGAAQVSQFVGLEECFSGSGGEKNVGKVTL